MPEKYGTHERATLIVLTLYRELPNPELRNEYGIDLRPAGRAKLNKDGLLETRTERRSYVHTITEAGIAWCEQELTVVEAPPRTGPLARAGFEALRRLASHLQRQGVRLAEVLHPSDDLETVIRKAYDELKRKPRDWVRLAQLRPKLDGAGKSEVDEKLLAMTKTGLVHLAPDSDRGALTDDDRKAAIRIGKEDKHLVAIEES
jgi:hypothetical protein